jgi:hypothetical protein
MNIVRKGDCMKYIEIEISGRGKAVAEIDDWNPKVAAKFYQRLPIEAKANLWGEEVYFEVPLALEDENPSPSSKSGDISYWSPGSAFCIFFGQTQPYSPVNHLGMVIEGLDLFKDVKNGDRIVLSRK